MLGFSRTAWARVAREGVWAAAGQVVTAVAALAGVRVLTELAPPAVFGEASLWLGVLVLVRNFFIVPLSAFQIRYHSDYAARGQAGPFTARMRRLMRLSTLGFVLALATAYSAWVILAPAPFRPLLLVALACCACLDGAKCVRQNVLAADRRQKPLAVWWAVESWSIVVACAASLWAVPNTEAYLLGTAAGSFLPLALILLVVPFATGGPSATGRSPDEPDFYRQAAAYGLPFIPLAVVVWFTNLGDRYLLNGLRGTDEVGLYVAAFGIASKPAILVGGTVALAARPILFDAVSRGLRRKARHVFRLWLVGIFLLSGGLVLMLAVLGPWIARWFLAAEYREGAPAIMVWVAAGFGIYAAVQVVENRIMSFGRSTSLISPASVGAALKLILTYLLVQSDGSLGAARATFLAFVGQFLVTVWAMTRLEAADARGPADEPPGRPAPGSATGDAVRTSRSTC